MTRALPGARRQVVFAVDIAAGGRGVALKLMRHGHQIRAEIDARLVDGAPLPDSAVRARPLRDPTFSRTVCRLYGGAKGLVMWY